MALFLKKGVNKKKGGFIYPEPTQTNTDNCAAYAGTSCLYAFGLDHESGLIPDVNGGTPGEQFQVQIQRMVERLTELIYTKNNSTAEGYRKYIEEKGLKDKFEVTEFSGDGSMTLSDGSKKSNFEFALDELKRCQDIIPFIKWNVKDQKKKEARHAVTLVGIDEATNEVVVANPWGTPYGTTHVPPDEAGANTEAGKTDRAHTRYKFKRDGNKVTVEFESFTAVVYNFVKICPVPKQVAMVTPQPPRVITPTSGATTVRFAYDVANVSFQPVNAVAIQLPGIQPSEIVRIAAPEGWSSAIWYRDREPGFDLLAPELPDPEPGTFAGVIWRASDLFIRPDEQVTGFSFDLSNPSFDIKSEELKDTLESDTVFSQVVRTVGRLETVIARINTWMTTSGHAVLVNESADGVQALHLTTEVPQKFCSVGEAVDNLLRALEPRGDHYFPQPLDPVPVDKSTINKKK
jgi:hypothetical protein